jgi:hypothetical protein
MAALQDFEAFLIIGRHDIDFGCLVHALEVCVMNVSYYQQRGREILSERQAKAT